VKLLHVLSLPQVFSNIMSSERGALQTLEGLCAVLQELRETA
jgi:hypothetical protein